MIPAKLCVLYTVQNVKDAIMNGDSDFKINSDSYSSDEETDGDVLKAQKENILSTDCAAHDYVDNTLCSKCNLIFRGKQLFLRLSLKMNMAEHWTL